jgi:tetratricopeptide (TPR) repeat protein
MKHALDNNDKIGRNDPCHCGSGQKYKKCCLNKDRAEQYTPENFDPVSFKREMEQMLRKIGKIAENKNMSAEDLNNYFVGKHMDDINDDYEEMGAPQTPQEIAQDLVYEAMDMPYSRARKALTESALKIYPHLADAWIILAEETATTPQEALECYKKAVVAGEKDLGKQFFKDNVGHFWGMTESRPYMRAKVYLAQTLWDLGFEDDAITHYKDCLRLNPNDNQGVRDVLTTRLLIKNDLDGVEAIQKQYKEDFSAQYSYNRALLLFKKNGPGDKQAMNQLKKAVKRNSFVANFLLGKTKMPKQIPGAYAMGSKEEAIIYTYDALRAWKETPGAFTWLLQSQ